MLKSVIYTSQDELHDCYPNRTLNDRPPNWKETRLILTSLQILGSSFWNSVLNLLSFNVYSVKYHSTLLTWFIVFPLIFYVYVYLKLSLLPTFFRHNVSLSNFYISFFRHFLDIMLHFSKSGLKKIALLCYYSRDMFH